MSGSGASRLVQSTLEGASESTLAEGLMNANERAKSAKGKGEKKSKKK